MPFEQGNNHGKDHRFQPGKSGNPAGRPRAAASIREWWNRLMEEDGEGVPVFTVRDLWQIREAEDDDRTVPAAKRIAAAMIIDALKGGRRAIEVTGMLFDREEGRPSQSLNVSAQLSANPAREITEQTLQRNRAAAGNGE